MNDAHQSVLQIPALGSSRVYCAYGLHLPSRQPSALLAFNGEYAESQTGNYLLGNGNRTYNPVLMRFHSADSFSPFGQGGINPYAYCLGDPVNNFDPTGNWPWSRKAGAKSSGIETYPVLKNDLGSTLSKELTALADAFQGGDKKSGRSYGNLTTWEPAEVNVITSRNDLVPADPARHSSWVLTKTGKFVVGTYTIKGPKLSHAAIAEYARKELSAGAEVVAAGELKVVSKSKIFFDDQSGHFKPPATTRALARKHLKGLGITAEYMIIRKEL
jgi:RHS repeat-associated protein